MTVTSTPVTEDPSLRSDSTAAADELACSAETLSVRSRALRASAWVVGSKPLGMAIQLARSLILTRLLFPEAFGLMALVGVILQGLAMCSDVGIGPNIIQSKRGEDEKFLQTAWTLQIIRGFVLWLICCALAWPAAAFYGEPMLLYLLPVAGVSVLIAGFGTTAGPTHQRQMKLGLMIVLGYAALLLNLVIMVLAAWWLRSVWALVIGSLSGNLIGVLIGHRFLPGVKHRFAWDRAALHELVRFGKWVFISTLLTFFAMQLDKLLLGKLIPMNLLGVYAIALVLANLPRELLQQISGLVLMPALSEKFRDDRQRMHQKVSRARGVLLRVGLLLCLGVAFIAPLFFQLYDERYAAAGWMAQLLAVSAWMTVLNATTGNALLALGDSKALAAGNLLNVIVTLGGALGGYHLYGLPGFILGYAAGTAAGELTQGLWLRRHGIGVLRQDAAFTVVGTLAGAVVLLPSYWLEDRGHPFGPWAQFAIGLVAWSFMAIRVFPTIKQELFGDRPIPGLGWLTRARSAVNAA